MTRLFKHHWFVLHLTLLVCCLSGCGDRSDTGSDATAPASSPIPEKFFQLMRMYRDLADSMLTSNVINLSYYDACRYDIEGLESEFESEIDADGDVVYLVNDHNSDLVEHLEGQVKALRKLIEGAKGISFMFG